MSACGFVLNEAQSLHFRYGSRVALSTPSPIRYLLGPKTRFPVRRLHLLTGREFHPLETPGLSWRAVVQVYVGQERADWLPLSRPCFTYEKSSVFDDSDLDPLADQAEHASVVHSLLYHPYQSRSHNRIKVGADVYLQNPRDRPGADD